MSEIKDVDMETETKSKGDKKVDEGLYSRQLYVFGHEAQLKMQSTGVLIVGLKGLGAEIGEFFLFFVHVSFALRTCCVYVCVFVCVWVRVRLCTCESAL